MSFLNSIGNFLTNRPGEEQQRKGLLGMGQQGQAQYNALGGRLGTEADWLGRVSRGEESLSAEQLRRSLQQNLAAQQSMAAGAAPQNQAMAALHASRNAMQLGSGLAGQQAEAGIQERAAAHDALARMLLQQRQQEQSNAQYGYGQAQPGQSWLDRFGGAVMGIGSLASGAFGRGGGQQRQAPAAPPAPAYSASGGSPLGNQWT